MRVPLKTTYGTFTFKRWTRQPYAVFLSLGAEIRIAGLALAVSAIMLPKETDAQVQDSSAVENTVEMDEVVVTAQRSEVIYSQMARTVEVLEEDEIEGLPVQSVDQLLEYAMNVDIRQRGGMDVQSDISIRAGSFDQVMILLNGVNITDPQTGHHNLTLPVDLSAIKRIEILSGPGSRIFGPQAFSGAINIITGPGDDKNLHLALKGGQFGYAKAVANITYQTNNMNHLLSANYSRSDGYIDNTDFNKGNAFYRNIWKIDEYNCIDLQMGYNQKAFGANSFYTPEYPEQFEEIRTKFASVKWESGKKIKTETRIYGRRNHDRFELFRYDTPAWYGDHNYHLTDIAGASINTVIPLKQGKLSLGTEYRYERIFSNVLGVPMKDTLDAPGEKNGFFDHKDSRNNLSAFAEYAAQWKNFYLAMGIMANNVQGIHGKWRWFPGLDLNYQITKNWHLFSSASYGMRLPTFTDLYYDGPVNQGNANLKPEKSTSLELGTKYFGTNYFVRLTTYKRWGKNIIDWVKMNAGDQWKTMNLTEVITTGASLQSEIDLESMWKRNWISNLRFSYSFADQHKKTGNYISRYAMDYLKHKVNLRLEHQMSENFDFSWSITWQDRAGSFTLYENGTYGKQTDYKPFLLVDARLTYQVKEKYNFYLEISNLFDQQYYDLGNIPQPGIWGKAGLSVNLNL